MSTDHQNSSDGNRVIKWIKEQLSNGKSKEEIIAYLIERGALPEDARSTVHEVYYLLTDYIEKQIALGRPMDETISEIIEHGANPELTKTTVSRLYILKSMEKSAIKSLEKNEQVKQLIESPETKERLKRYSERYTLSQRGLKHMSRGAIILIVGTLITLVTYNFPIGNYYFIFYGAIIFGAIDFLIGLIQWLMNK